MYRRFGSRVTIVEMQDRLIARDDDDVSEAVRDILQAEGIEVRLSAECLAAKKRNRQISVRVECDEGAPEVVGSHLLLAVGRTPNTDDLGLEEAGIETDPARLHQGRRPAADQRSERVGTRRRQRPGARSPTRPSTISKSSPPTCSTTIARSVNDRITAYGLYIDPPLGRAGLTEREVRASGRKALIGKMAMSRVGAGTRAQ